MTLEERELLQKFLHELIQARVTRKDHVAEALILNACKRQPDALYLMVQRLMMAEQALDDCPPSTLAIPPQPIPRRHPPRRSF